MVVIKQSCVSKIYFIYKHGQYEQDCISQSRRICIHKDDKKANKKTAFITNCYYPLQRDILKKHGN